MEMTKTIPAKNVPTKVNEKRLLLKRKSSMFWLWRFLNNVYEPNIIAILTFLALIFVVSLRKL